MYTNNLSHFFENGCNKLHSKFKYQFFNKKYDLKSPQQPWATVSVLYTIPIITLRPFDILFDDGIHVFASKMAPSSPTESFFTIGMPLVSVPTSFPTVSRFAAKR